MCYSNLETPQVVEFMYETDWTKISNGTPATYTARSAEMILRFTVVFLPLSLYYVGAADILFVILDEPNGIDESISKNLQKNLESSCNAAAWSCEILSLVRDFPAFNGGWAVWPLAITLSERYKTSESRPKWLFVAESFTEVNVLKLKDYLASKNSPESQYIGHGLRDQSTTIIHHFAFATGDPSKFLYPDFGGGLALSWSALYLLIEKLSSKKSDFTIDPKHELAMLLWDDNKGIELTEANDLFCTQKPYTDNCITKLQIPVCTQHPLSSQDIYFAVKTFHQHHKSRIVVVKRTWAKDTWSIEYFSDIEDPYIPSISLGIENTERVDYWGRSNGTACALPSGCGCVAGHCAKTLAILKRFRDSSEWENIKWLVIADDDTLLSVPRLVNLLRCYNPLTAVMLGERYGYGFSTDGNSGYAYPTGGSGMIFSRPAVVELLKECNCPSVDSPDDMILGMCARNIDLPVLHSAALHQARPDDYSLDYLHRQLPISFHKHWEIDPYRAYVDWLKENSDQAPTDKAAKQSKHSHTDL